MFLGYRGFQLARPFERLAWRLRCLLWNMQSNIHVSPDAWIAKSAQLQMVTDGRWRGGHIHIGSGVIISDGVLLAPYGGRIFMDERSFVGPYSIIYGGRGGDGMGVGKRTMIAGHVVAVPSNHGTVGRLPMRDQACTSVGITIGDDVWIGAGVKILDGVRIGTGCVIGAGAVVSKSLPDYAIAVGIPARVVRIREDTGPARPQDIASKLAAAAEA
jgi:acetyltransferase-like isoleucine patch superfamily enzyme